MQNLASQQCGIQRRQDNVQVDVVLYKRFCVLQVEEGCSELCLWRALLFAVFNLWDHCVILIHDAFSSS
jgi:hypothetical protein